MRIVALSDQHGTLPEIPPCDLVIVGGDVCPDGLGRLLAQDAPHEQARWFHQTIRPWLAEARTAHRILTWGNHDWCGQACDFSSDAPGRVSDGALQIVVDTETRVPVPAGRPGGAGVDGCRIWATPWSNQFMEWAFMKSPDALAAVYAAIPSGVDILVSHQPPFGYGDRLTGDGSGQSAHLGSRELLGAIERVRPRLVICGHIHGGHGRYEHRGVPIYNVAVLDDQYRPAHDPTIIEI
jgi:3',5'-cyclic AMP phosphodiesterase CpdA